MPAARPPESAPRGHPKEAVSVLTADVAANPKALDLPTVIPIELWCQVIDDLPLRSMLELGATCKAFRELVHRQLLTNVRARYRAFVSDVDGLEEIMLHCHAVVCGSFVASLISGASHWEPQNLDFVLPGRGNSEDFIEFVEDNGYVEAIVPFAPSTLKGDQFTHSFERRRIFHRYSDNAQITVMVCTSGSTSHVINRFYSTLSFQFITPRYLCCAYPCLTLFDNAILNPNGRHGAETNYLWERYDRRGWDHWTWATSAWKYTKGIPSRFLCPHKPRFVGDAGCLIVPLTRKDVFTPRHEFMLREGNLESHGLRWVVGGAHCPLRCKSKAASSASESKSCNFF